MSLCIGLMSGTSADGMDACLVDITEQQVTLIDALCIEYPKEVSEFFKAIAVADNLSAELVMDADRLIAQYGVQAVVTLLNNNQTDASEVELIGSHGHTLRHRPQPDGFSWQIGDPSWIAEHTGITCVADFRRRDIAAGGEGAPLVPAFHQHVFADREHSAVLNIGGVANLTLLNDTLTGFDTGPGNALIDEYCQRILGQTCDSSGSLAATGVIIPELLEQWLAHPYFAEEPPKSTGREVFNLDAFLPAQYSATDADILRTLTELTAATVSTALSKWSPATRELLVCGGGLKNTFLIERIAALLPEVKVQSSAEAGADPDWMEAMAFAWLGWRTMKGLSGNASTVTGAQGERILGGIFPA